MITIGFELYGRIFDESTDVSTGVQSEGMVLY